MNLVSATEGNILFRGRDITNLPEKEFVRWPHLRTTNPIESTFATVRLRTHRTKGCGSRIATLTMVFKLGMEAQKHWRRLHGFELIPKVVTGVRFVDGEEQTQQAA
jgi:putative transposase